MSAWKKMMATAAVMAMSAAGAAHAESMVSRSYSKFEGPSIVLSADVDMGAMAASDGSSSNASRWAPTVHARWSKRFGEQFLMGVGLTAMPGSRTAGSYANGAEATMRDKGSIDLIPGVVLDSYATTYLRLSAMSGNAVGPTGASNSVQGFGWGIGLRTMIKRSWFIQLEGGAYRFNDATFGSVTSSFTGSVFSVGAGYQF